jgi:hypothetical protein
VMLLLVVVVRCVTLEEEKNAKVRYEVVLKSDGSQISVVGSGVNLVAWQDLLNNYRTSH